MELRFTTATSEVEELLDLRMVVMVEWIHIFISGGGGVVANNRMLKLVCA